MLDFLQKPKIIKENFWALLIEPEWISSAIWQITDGKVEIVNTSPATRWEDDLTEAVDISLSACTQNFPDDAPDPTKTVFGVPNTWIEGGNIKEEYLVKLKKICQDLSLVPSGFVVLSEAISHYIKQDEGTTLSGIVVGISDENLDISIFDTGKLVATTSVLRSVSVEDDMMEGLSRLNEGSENFPSRIILFNQKEQELNEIKNNLNDTDWNKIGNSKFVHPPRIEIFDPSKKILAVALAGGSEIGDVIGVVAETKVEELPIEEISNIEEPKDVTAEDLGFVTGPKFNFKKPNLKLPKLHFSLGSKPLILGGSLILVALVISFILWWFLPKAIVTIYVLPKKLEENISLNLDKDIKGKNIDVSVSGEKTKTTTGIKMVGEKAKGSVKLQNGTTFPINLPAGSILVSSTDLKFITVKSSSISGALSPSTPGTTTVDVEAGTIGSEYNLAKDEVFKVGNYPKAEFDGTSTDSFSGGSSRQISAVSQEDRESLLDDLTKELMDNAKLKLNEMISFEDYLVESSLTTDTTSEDFSNKVGDEASSIKLSLTLNVSGLNVLKSDLASISKEKLNDKVPSGFVLKDDQLAYEFIANDNNDFDVRLIANLLPSIDPNEVAKKIAGKYPELAEDYLSNMAGFARAEFRLKPYLPGKLGTLPHVPKNITVEFSAER